MNRRDSIVCGVAAALSLVFCEPLQSGRRFFRRTPSGEWNELPMMDLRPDDVFRVHDAGMPPSEEWVAVRSPVRTECGCNAQIECFRVGDDSYD